MAASVPKIVKTTGAEETFDEHKLRGSLRRARASPDEIRRVMQHVRDNLHDRMTTRQIYRLAFTTLRTNQHRRRTEPAERATAARYSLQRAILELGPTGYPFERFLGELLRHDGFRVAVGASLPGRFVRHEIDVVAERRRERVLAECKFRADPAGKVDVQIAMYVSARAQDLRDAGRGWTSFWLVTNGRFTRDALLFGEGTGLTLLSWNHPEGGSLRERIDRAGLHPVTCLTGLRKAEKQALLRTGLVVVADLHDHPRELDRLRLSQNRLQNVRAEIDGLCS